MVNLSFAVSQKKRRFYEMAFIPCLFCLCFAFFGIDDLALGLIAGSVISGIGGIASSAMSASSASASNRESYKYTNLLQEDQQAFNSDEARIAREFNSQEAEKNRQYQERMSNSAYQRAVADLRKAGLNPLLAVGAQASTPVGSAASAGAATSSAGSVSAKMADYSGLSEAGKTIGGLVAQVPQIKQNIAESQSREKLNVASSAESAARAQESVARAHLADAQAAKTKLEAAGIDPEVVRDNMRYGNSSYGKWLNDLSRVVHDNLTGTQVLHSAKSVDEAVKRAETAVSSSKDSARMRHENSRHKPLTKRRHK